MLRQIASASRWLLWTAVIQIATMIVVPQAGADEANMAASRAHFFELCDLAANKVRGENNKGPFFADSYAVRALCAAYDMTGDTNYLDACRMWSERMVQYQEQMSPRGAYYINYNRKPGETNGDWYVADSSSIGIAVLATAMRCQGAEQARLLGSAKAFADLVITHYVKPSGGVSDGLWSKSSDEWWNSSALFGAFLFNLYKDTGDRLYLQTALHETEWLSHWDLTKDQPFPLSEQGPAMLMYVMENYSAGWAYISKDEKEQAAAQAKINWCLDWITNQEQKPVSARPWPVAKGWGMKFGGLPFHEYVFAHYFPVDQYLRTNADHEMETLARIVFADHPPKLTQLSMFLMLSYAEDLNCFARSNSLPTTSGDQSGDQNVYDHIDALVNNGICGPALQARLKIRADGLLAWNRPYKGDGVTDCYGYCRQVWNAILFDGSAHTEDFTNYDIGRAKYWENVTGGIPVNTYPDSNWVSIASLGGVSNLVCGDLVGTVKGHRWGMDVHYGLAAGNNMDWDCHGGLGAEYRTFYPGFTYCYAPLHKVLASSPPNQQ